MQISESALRQNYESKSTEELLEIEASGTLTDEARAVLDSVIAARGVTPEDRHRAAVLSEIRQDNERRAAGPTGIGGWLVLVAIGLVISPFRLLVFAGQTYLPIFRDGTWSLLTTPGSESYDPMWAPVLILEVLGNLGFILAGVWLVVLFFKLSPWFPKAYIWVAVINPVFIILDAWLASHVVAGPMFDPETGAELGKAILAALIWVPYMLVSKRVRNTFVSEDEPSRQPAEA